MNNLTAYHPNSCNLSLDYLKQCCPRSEKGGIRHMLLVNKNYQPTLVAELNAAGNDAAAQLAAWFRAQQAERIVVVPNVLGNYDGGSPNDSQGYGGVQSRTTGMEHTAEIDDINVVGNRAFAAALMQSQQYVLWFATADLIWNTHAPCGISARMPVAREYTSEVKYVYTAKWSTPQPPQHYWLPAALFDCAPFSAVITAPSVVDDTVNLQATYSQPCVVSGTLTLTAASYDDGSAVTDVSAYFGPAETAIAGAATTQDFSLTDSRGNLAAGTYVFSFEVAGCGSELPQTVTTTVLVL